jgi:hypothetical protein
MNNQEPSRGRQDVLAHFWTFVWLRWRIRMNQLSHSSSIGKALAAVFYVCSIASAILLLIASFVLGIVVPRYVPTESYFLIWDAIALAVGFIWILHVISDLQRSDAVTLDRILQLPIHFWQAFAVNYASSLWNLPFMSIASICIGFSLGSCFSIGPRAILLMLPLVATLAAMTALTYQLQGWLAAIMSNPRKRQLVIVLLPITIILLIQLPAMLATRASKQFEGKKRAVPNASAPQVISQEPMLAPELEAPEDTPKTPEVVPETQAVPPSPALSESQPEKVVPSPALPQASGESEEQAVATAGEKSQPATGGNDADRRKRNRQRLIELMTTINFWVPPLWIASSAQSIVQGTGHFAWQTLGLAAVAYWSLRRNYMRTLSYYRGQQHESPARRKPSSGASDAAAITDRRHKVKMIEWQLPWVDEMTSAVTAMTWQSMMRAPEVKMYFLIPFIFPIVLLGTLRSIGVAGANELKACLSVGAVSFALLISSGMLANLFGYDRTGFRAYVLSPIPRANILFGKNLATLPLLLLQVFVLSVGIGLFAGIPFLLILASLVLSLSMVPLFVLLFNLMSMLAPFPIAAGSVQPKHFDLIPVVMSMMLSILMPLIAVLGMLPLGIEWLLHWVGNWSQGIPWALLLSWIWLGGSLLIYRALLPLQGQLFAKREKELLRIVTSRVE